MEETLAIGLAISDDSGWAERCGYWLNSCNDKRRPGRTPRHINEALILTGHGMCMRVDNGALLVRNGFTHYPQAREARFQTQRESRDAKRG